MRLALVLLSCLGLLAAQFFFQIPGAVSARTVNQEVNTAGRLQNLRSAGEQQCLQPPQNIDLTTLSDTDLSLYGLPPHSVLERQPARWRNELQYAKHRTCGTHPGPKGVYSSPTHTARPSTTERNSLNWAGNVAYGNVGTYREAGVDFTVPSPSSMLANQRVTVWAGLGGDDYYTNGNYPVLVQAGVDVSTEGNVSFWEVWPYNTEQDLPLTHLAAGDLIYSYVNSNLNYDGYNYFYLENKTAGTYNSHYDTTRYSDSTSGECILERPTVNGSYTGLANFGTERFTGCYVGNNTGSTYTGIQNWPHDYHNMVDSSGNTMATVGPISNTTDYSVYWHRSS